MAKYCNWIIGILVVVLLVLGQKYKTLQSENDDLKNQVADYDSALTQANNNIDDGNSMIEDAQGNAWGTYEDMGDALDNLTTIDNVDRP